jgi:sigma-B regulation protein RsbU (phosphoserine phosphatase)
VTTCVLIGTSRERGEVDAESGVTLDNASAERLPVSYGRELALIKRVTERLLSSLDFRDALATLIDGAIELLRVERGSLLLVDQETETLRIEVARGLDPKVVERTRIEIGQGIAGTVAATGEPVMSEDVRELPSWRESPPNEEQAADYSDYSALCVPLALRGRVLGVMTFNHKRGGEPFTERDLEFALLIANQAAVVLWSAQLHREYLEKQVLDREMKIARSIQERLRPQDLPEVPGFHYAARQVMCQAVGGDYFDMFRLHDGQIVIAVGDAAGHGVGAALVAAQVRATLRECLLRGDSLAASLGRVSDRVHLDTSPEMYMTLILGLLDPVTRFFEFYNAGHHLPVLVREGRTMRIRAVGKNLPLGIRRGQTFAPEWPLGLRDDDLVLFFTDGIWEIVDAADQRFGDGEMSRTLVRDCRLGLDQVLESLLRGAIAHGGLGELEDDCTLFALRTLEVE